MLNLMHKSFYFCTPAWKLHNLYCHSAHQISLLVIIKKGVNIVVGAGDFGAKSSSIINYTMYKNFLILSNHKEYRKIII